MFVTCPSCSTRYQIDESRLGARGRTVRCTRCKHQWVQSPEGGVQPRPEGAKAAAPSVSAEAAPTLSAPSRVVTRRSGARGELLIGWLAFVIVVGGSIAVLWFGRANIMEQWPVTARFYALVGIESQTAPGEGLTLQEVKTETIDNDGTPTLVVTGKIVNTSAVPRDIPKMRAALRDANAHELQFWIFEVEAKRLLPGESLEFETHAPNPSPDAKGLSIVFVAGSDPQ